MRTVSNDNFKYTPLSMYMIGSFYNQAADPEHSHDAILTMQRLVEDPRIECSTIGSLHSITHAILYKNEELLRLLMARSELVMPSDSFLKACMFSTPGITESLLEDPRVNPRDTPDAILEAIKRNYETAVFLIRRAVIDNEYQWLMPSSAIGIPEIDFLLGFDT